MFFERIGRALHGKWFLGEPLWNRRGFNFACIWFHFLCAASFIIWLILALFVLGAHTEVYSTGTHMLYNRWGYVDYVSMGGFVLILLFFLIAAILWSILALDRWYAKTFTKSGRINWQKVDEEYGVLIAERKAK